MCCYFQKGWSCKLPMSHFALEATVDELTKMDAPVERGPLLRWQRKAIEAGMRAVSIDGYFPFVLWDFINWLCGKIWLTLAFSYILSVFWSLHPMNNLQWVCAPSIRYLCIICIIVKLIVLHSHFISYITEIWWATNTFPHTGDKYSMTFILMTVCQSLTKRSSTNRFVIEGVMCEKNSRSFCMTWFYGIFVLLDHSATAY